MAGSLYGDAIYGDEDFADLYGEGAERVVVVERTVIVRPYPKAVRAKEAEYFFGVRREMLNRWVAAGKVIAWREEKAVFYDFATIDRKVEGEDAGLEYKTAGARREDAFQEGRLPASYVRQVKTYMKVTGYPRWYAYVWVMGVREVCYLFTTLDEAKPDWCDALVRVNEAELDECEEIAASFFADHVEPGVEPPYDGDEDERNLIKELNPEATANGPLVLSGVTEADLANLDAWKQAVAETEGRIAAVEDRIKSELGAFAEGWVGSRKVTWRNNKPSRKVDWKAVVAEVAPPAEVIDRHTAITPGARVLRIGKAV